MRAEARAAAFLLICPLAACADGAHELGWLEADTLADGRIIMSHADVRSDRILLTEDLRIGEIDGDGPNVLGSVISIGVDPGGTIHVGDAHWSQIKVFDTNGAFLRAMGGSGEGPGEFRGLEGSALDTDGRLWAMDFLARRLTVFDSEGNVVDTQPHARGSLHFSLPWIGRTDQAGHLYDVDAATHTFLVRYRTSGARLEVVDSLRIPEVEQQTYTIQRGPFIETASVPFSPQVIWDISPTGDVWVGTTSSFALHKVTMGGDTLVTVRLSRSGEPLSGEERDSIAELTGLAERQLPGRKPVMYGIVVGIDGRLWIQLERRASSEWEMFTAEGLHVGTVVSPVPLKSRPRPFAYSEGIIAVTEDELGIEYVVRLVF